MPTSLTPRRGTPRDQSLPAPGAGADLHPLALDGRVLYWPACGHADDDDVVLYDRPVCVTCETEPEGDEPSVR